MRINEIEISDLSASGGLVQNSGVNNFSGEHKMKNLPVRTHSVKILTLFFILHVISAGTVYCGDKEHLEYALILVEKSTYEKLNQEDILVFQNVRQTLAQKDALVIENSTKGYTFQVTFKFTKREREIILKGGLLNFIKSG